jgi:cytochrome b561
MASRYDLVAIALHWSIALLIVAAFILGLTVDDFLKAWDQAVVNAHVLIGLAVLTLTAVRIGWRISHKPPLMPNAGNLVLGRMAKLVHFLLYCLMLVVPAIGIPTLFYRGRGIDFGVFEIPPLLSRTPEIFRPLTELQEVGAYALLILALGHVLAALYHQVILRDRLMLRMVSQTIGDQNDSSRAVISSNIS